MKLRHFFLPHPDTHAKAHFISPVGLFVWIALFIILQVSLSLVNTIHPGILGVTANIDYKEVIRLVNLEREKKGLGALKENPNLNVAAYKKGENMIEENYWAHYSPSGKDPWGFILGSGYKYSYAGENLARNFSNAQDAVTAWMNSPTHRDNILNAKYRDIGISVVQGKLNGEETTLIVQEFGTPVNYTASNPFTKLAEAKTEATPTPQPSVQSSPEVVPATLDESPTPNVAAVSFTPPIRIGELPGTTINQFSVYRTVGIGIVGGIAFMLVVDWLVLYRRGVFRPASQHVAHLALLGVSFSALVSMGAGRVL